MNNVNALISELQNDYCAAVEERDALLVENIELRKFKTMVMEVLEKGDSGDWYDLACELATW